MISSSAATEKAFEAVKWPHVTVLLAVLRESDSADEQIIERRYCENATNYLATATFLHALGLIERANQRIVSRISDLCADRTWQEVLLDQLTQTASIYRDEIFDYLGGFILSDQAITRPIDVNDASRQSGPRNFLMELGVVHCNMVEGYYYINSSHVWLYALSRSTVRIVHPSSVRSCVSDQCDIGDLAEQAVVEWERQHLGKDLAHWIEHVAATNAAAGYDVLSLSVSDGRRQRKFIEVKAVSKKDWRFYWTKNEVATARALGSHYFLYLVPIGENGRPDLNGTKQIANPCSVLFGDENWVVESNVLECRMKAGNVE